MILEQLRVHDFRNIRDVVLTPAATFNVFFGANGQGKTSLLEALHFVAEGRSFRSGHRSDLVRRGSAHMAIDAHVRSRLDTVDELRASLSGTKKELRVNGREATSLEKYLGNLRVVVHSPDDSHLISGPPDLRRRFLNRVLVLAKPGFFEVLARYVRALRNRNRCLQEHRSRDEIDSWTEPLIRAGARILASRLELIRQLEPRISSAARRISANSMPLALRYRASGAPLDDLSDETASGRWLASEAERLAGQEQRHERTLFGPHLDDLDIQLEAGPARRHASQGERRSVLVALRLAERAVIADQTGEDPVFLLDDLSSELDAARADRVIDAVAQVPGQVFLTGTERRVGPPRARSFEVRGGQIFDEARMEAPVPAVHAPLDPSVGRSLS